MRFIGLDSNNKVISEREGWEIIVGEIQSEKGEIGQIMQADGTFIDSIPPLEQIKNYKIAQIKDLYNQKLEAGFTSSATGTIYTFGYGATDQMKFMQLAIMVMAGKAMFPVTVHTKDSKDVSHDQTQYNQLVTDIATFAQPLDVKEHDYITQVQACTTIDQVNEITVSF